MASIGVNYDSLANVQRSLEEDIADDQLTQINTDLTTANSTISDISSEHDNIWSNAIETISEQLTSITDSIESVLELATRTGNVSDTFYSAENQIKENVSSIDGDLAEYFGLPENTGLTVTATTGATTTTQATAGHGAGDYPVTTGATPGTDHETTVLKQEKEKTKDDKEKTEDKDKTKDDDKDKSPQTIEDKDQEKESKETDDKENDNNKDETTYQKAKDNAESTSSSSVAKNVTSSVAGTSAMGTATGAASAIGNPNNSTTTSNESIENEEIDTENEEVTGEALGEFTEDPVEGTIEIETESGSHQTDPIDVTIDKANGTSVVPALAGVAAAGASGIGTKVVLDKMNTEDKDEDEEENETFSGDYEVAGTKENEQLDMTDDIGFDPTEIIEKDELGGNSFSENLEEDSESSEEEGFNSMPALAGALAGGLAGAAMLSDDDDEDDSKQ